VPHPLGDIEVKLARVGARGLSADVTLPRGLSGQLDWHAQSRVLRPGRQVIRID
jgi:hypothetical protein